jgi:hypothetical protein
MTPVSSHDQPIRLIPKNRKNQRIFSTSNISHQASAPLREKCPVSQTCQAAIASAR